MVQHLQFHMKLAILQAVLVFWAFSQRASATDLNISSAMVSKSPKPSCTAIEFEWNKAESIRRTEGRSQTATSEPGVIGAAGTDSRKSTAIASRKTSLDDA